MKTIGKARASGKGVSDDYVRLIHEFPLKPIRSDADYDRAAAVLDRLVVRDKLSDGERDYMDALTLFVEDYDNKHYAPKPRGRTPRERVKSLMHTAGMTPAQLGDIIGSRPAASMFLNGDRDELSKAQIRKLAARFKLDPGYFF